MIQTSCSELLVDTKIHDYQDAFVHFSKIAKLHNWEFSPPLSMEILQQIKKEGEGRHETTRLAVYDKDGNSAVIQYGDNGYLKTGFRFDSECNNWDEKCYPIFKIAINELNGELIACDGGSTDGYEDWEAGRVPNDNED
jgi:hypothetical protein